MGAIRLFLALVVAVDHLRQSVLHPAGLEVPGIYELGVNAGFAVMFFYMISGFLISLVLTQKYPAGLAGSLAFYQSRFIRIFSLYWPVAILLLVAFGVTRGTFPSSTYDAFTNLFLFSIDWRIAFANYPELHWSAGVPWLLQAWTLGAELTFYVLAPWLLRSWRVVLAMFVVSAAIRAAFVYSFGFDVRWTYLFLPSTFLFFLLGHMAQTLSCRLAWLRNGYIGTAFLLGCVACLTVGSYANWDGVRFWAAVLCLAAALPGTFHATSEWHVLNLLGGLSYPVYLTHAVLVGLLAERQEQLGQLVTGRVGLASAVVAVSFLLACVLVACAAHWLIERPVATLMRSVVGVVRSLRPARAEM